MGRSWFYRFQEATEVCCWFYTDLKSHLLSTRSSYRRLLNAVPHNGKDLIERSEFYTSLEHAWDHASANQGKYIMGDLNARIGLRRPGEEHILGEFCFGREAVHTVEQPNRELLMEFCMSRDMVVANSLHDVPDHQRVTYHEPCMAPCSPISVEGFAVLDLCLVPSHLVSSILQTYSDRLASLASHHFPVISIIRVNVHKREVVHKREALDWTQLRVADTRSKFVASLSCEITGATNEMHDLTERWLHLSSSMRKAAHGALPNVKRKAKKPWISESTLNLLELRQNARVQNDWMEEQRLRKEVKRSAKRDRAKWLDELASTGDWNSLKILKGSCTSKQTRLANHTGDVVSTEERAQTFARHLETYQWHERDAPYDDDVSFAIREDLPVKCGPISEAELTKAINALAAGKSFREGDVPIECFKAVAAEGGVAFCWLLDICNQCWAETAFPPDWLLAAVAML